MSIYWTGNTHTPVGRTYVIIGVITEFATQKTQSDYRSGLILEENCSMAFAGTVSSIDYVTISTLIVSCIFTLPVRPSIFVSPPFGSYFAAGCKLFAKSVFY